MQELARENLDGRELRAVRNRERIRAAALDLFEQRGVDRVTVDEIAAAAGVSRRSFFHHFPTKEDAALLPLERGGRLLSEAATASRRSKTFADAVIDVTLAALAAVTTATPDATRLAWRSARLAGREPRVHQRVAQLMLVWEQALDETLADVATDDDPLTRRITIAVVVAATRVALLAAGRHAQPEDLLPTVAAALESLRPTARRARARR